MRDLDLQLTLDRSKDLQRAAEHDRLVAEATAAQPSAADRVALAAGDVLVGAGQRLEHWARKRRMRRALARVHSIQ
jgi:hypothetical protein